jgi:hypothetical protein
MKNLKILLSGAVFIVATAFISLSFTQNKQLEKSSKIVWLKSERAYLSKCGSGEVQSKEDAQSKIDAQKEISNCDPKDCDKKDCKGKKSDCRGKAKDCKTKKTSCAGKKKECKTSKKSCSGNKKK